MFSLLYGMLCFFALGCDQLTSGQADDGKRYICRAIPVSGDASCPVTLLPELTLGGQEEELRNTVMQLRETILQQKETISKQLGTINELTTKLSLCASAAADRKYGKGGAWGKDKQNTMGDVPRDPNDSIDNLGKTMQGLKDRLENLEQQQMRANISGASFPSELRNLLQRRLGELEKQLLKKVSNLEEEKTMLSNATAAYRLKTESTLNALVERISELEKGGDFKSPEQFKLSLPQRTNYLYGRFTKSLPEMYAFTLCMWIKSSASPGIGTPFSYGVPGQANEIVLIEWGNNPIELLINDKVAQLPLEVRDGKWHHICISWTTRDGQWEAYQDGEKLGTGENLAAWHPIKPGGVIILGQEQDVVGGRFDAGQAFVGELSQVNIWDRILKPIEIQSMANCSSYIPGNVISWLASNVEVFGRGAFKRPLEMCLERLPNA